jgi:hypothetical protein
VPATDALPDAPDDDLTDDALCWAYDDRRDPSEVTLYVPDEGDRTTHWLTIDVEHAIDPADVA